MTGFVRNIGNVDGFGIIAFLADNVKSAGNGSVSAQADKFRSHKGTGGIFGILQNFVYLASGFRIGIFKNTFYHVCGHFLDNVDGIVKEHFVQNFFKFRVGKTLDKHFLGIAFQIDKNVRGHFFCKKAEHNRKMVFRHIVKKPRDIRRVHIEKTLAKVVVSFFVTHFFQFFSEFVISFFKSFFVFCHDESSFIRKLPNINNIPKKTQCQ